MYSPALGPNGTAANIASAGSLPYQYPGVDQHASTEPLATASKHSFAGIRALGSKYLSRILPPEIRSRRSTMLLPRVPSWVSWLGNQLAIFQRMRLSAASAVPTPEAASTTLSAAIERPVLRSFPVFIRVVPFVEWYPGQVHSTARALSIEQDPEAVFFMHISGRRRGGGTVTSRGDGRYPPGGGTP